MNFASRTMAVSLVVTVALLVASVAPALAAEFHSESATTFYSGSQVTENVLTTVAGKVKCKKATFTGKSTAKTVTTLEIFPTYSECTAFGQASETTMNGCHYDLIVTGPAAGSTFIHCPAGTGPVVIHNPGGNCKVTIPGQTPGTSSIDVKNEGAGASRDILFTWTVSGIKYTVDGPGTICGTPGTYEGASGASISGTVTEKGFSNEALTTQTGIWAA